MEKKATYYWLIQIIVWFSLNGITAVGYWISGNGLHIEMWQLILDSSVVSILCIAHMHIFKKYLIKYIEFDNLKITDSFKIIGLLLAITIIFYTVFILYIRLTYTFLYDRVDIFDDPSQGIKNNIIVIINYFIYFCIWSAFYIAIKGLMELNRERENRILLESNLRESQLNSLKGQINPHFMFNSLNNIRGLMREDVERARLMLTSLSENLRYSLTRSNANSIALEDELEVVENYIDLAKIQFEERLQFETDIDKNTLLLLIPPMIIQMLVENSIKHGIAKLKNGGFVRLSSKINDGLLEIIVVNSGSITQSENTTELGLENIKKRLNLLYGNNATFSLNEIENTVVATIQIPMP